MFHAYLHDMQERLTLLASGPDRVAVTLLAWRWLQRNDLDSETRVVISEVVVDMDAVDFIIGLRHSPEERGYLEAGDLL